MKNLRAIIITLLVGIVLYYITLPAINLSNFGFYVYVSFLVVVFNVARLSNFKVNFGKRSITKLDLGFDKIGIYSLILIPIVFVLIFFINFICSPLFNAKSYHERITVDESKDFASSISEVDFNKLPLIDKDSSIVLGDRVMGQMSEFVSQYNVSDLYNQINYNDKIVRVTPLEYASFIKWISNRKDGVKGYVIVNSVSGEAELVKLDKGIKYTPSGYFNDNLYRKLRFSYPFTNFGEISFEIDNEGNPYWIIPTIKYTAVELKAKVTGVIILNPISGESKKYDLEDIPTWVDNAFKASLIIEQLDDWGTYKNGFFNSVFGQKDVVNTTSGYNYLVMNDDVYLYTGITSVVNDESNLGFVLSNLRTGKTNYYKAPGAEEYSAMSSAEGQVQDMNYSSTFPLLINLRGKPTYLVSLKDKKGLVKMYGFIDVADYQKVVVTDSSKGILAAAQNYLDNVKFDISEENIIKESVVIGSINVVVINGNTYYFIESVDNKKYKLSISLSDNLPFVKVGDTINVGYSKERSIIEVEKVY